MGPTALLPLRRKCVLGIFITHKNPLSLDGFESVGPVASTLTTRPPRATPPLITRHISLFKSTITCELAACNTPLPKTSHNRNIYCKTLTSQAEATVSHIETNLYYWEAGHTILMFSYNVLASTTILTELFSNILKNKDMGSEWKMYTDYTVTLIILKFQNGKHWFIHLEYILFNTKNYSK
jgi:hypothetical protein